MPESVQSCFELSIYLSVKRTSRELLLKIVRGKKYRKMYGKFKNNNCLSSILNLFQFCQLMRLFQKDFQKNVLNSIQMPSFTKEFERMFISFSEIIVTRDMD